MQPRIESIEFKTFKVPMTLRAEINMSRGAAQLVHKRDLYRIGRFGPLRIRGDGPLLHMGQAGSRASPIASGSQPV